jgi:hypothetical protein
MFGFEEILEQIFPKIQYGINIWPLLFLAIVMVINTVTSMYMAYKSKQFSMDKALEFTKHFAQYFVLLFCLELSVVASPTTLVKDILSGIEVAVWGGIAIYYLFQLYQKFKSLGMPSNTVVENALNGKFEEEIMMNLREAGEKDDTIYYTGVENDKEVY